MKHNILVSADANYVRNMTAENTVRAMTAEPAMSWKARLMSATAAQWRKNAKMIMHIIPRIKRREHMNGNVL